MEEYTLDDSPPEIDLTKSAGAPSTSTVVSSDRTLSSPTNEQTLDTYVQKELCDLPVGTSLDTPAEIETGSCITQDKELAVSEELPLSVSNAEQLPVETTPANQDVLFTCPEDGLVLSQYPWTKSAVLKLVRLPSLTIDLWCNKIPDYYQFTPAELPVKCEDVTLPAKDLVESVNKTQPLSPTTEKNSYDADTDVDIDNLLQHAKTLVQQVKVELNTGADNPTEIPQSAKPPT